MGDRAGAGRSLRTVAITATVIAVPFAIYYFGYRSDQQAYHSQLYARKLDLIARQFSDSIDSMHKLVIFEQRGLAQAAHVEIGNVEEVRPRLQEAEQDAARRESELASVEQELGHVRMQLAEIEHEKEKYLSERFSSRLHASPIEIDAAAAPFDDKRAHLVAQQMELVEKRTRLEAARKKLEQVRAEHAEAVNAFSEKLQELTTLACPEERLACRHGAPFQELEIEVGPGSPCDGRASFEIGTRRSEPTLVARYSDGNEDVCKATIPLPDIALQGNGVRAFDAVLLATPDGSVMVQSEGSLPRITDLGAEIRNASVSVSRSADGDEEAGTEQLLNRLLGRHAVKTTRIAGVDYRVFPQPVRLPFTSAAAGTPPPGEASTQEAAPRGAWVFVGLLREKTFERDIAPPLDFLAVAMLVVLLAILAWPFLRLQLIDRTDSIRPSDLAFVVVALLLGAACISAALLDFVHRRNLSGRIDEVLESTARELRSGFEEELHTAVATLERATHDLGSPDSVLARCDAAALAKLDSPDQIAPERDAERLCFPGTANPVAPPYSTIFWLDADGRQVGPQLTYRVFPAQGRLALGTRDYFMRIRDRDTWFLPRKARSAADGAARAEDRGPRPFFAQRIVSWKEGTRETAISIDIRADGISPTDDRKPIAAVVLKPFEVFRRAVLGQGMGFAVLGEDGRVLYHSDDSLSLSEDFLVEVHPRSRLDAILASDVAETAQGEYHGDPHRFHASPLPDVPWHLVVFADERFVQAAHFGSVVVLSSTILAVALCGLALVLIMRALGWKLGLRWLWPQEAQLPAYRWLSGLLALLVIVALGIGLGEIPPNARAAPDSLVAFGLVVLLVLSGWTVCGVALAPSAPPVPGARGPDRRARGARPWAALAPLLPAIAVFATHEDLGVPHRPAIWVLMMIASVLAARIVFAPPRLDRHRHRVTARLRFEHTLLLVSGTLLSATVPAVLLLYDTSRLEMDRLVAANAYSVTRRLDAKARTIVRDGERFCVGVDDPVYRGENSKIRDCVTYAEDTRSWLVPDRVGLRWLPRSEDVVFERREGASPTRPGIAQARNVLGLAFHPYSSALLDANGRTQDPRIEFEPGARLGPSEERSRTAHARLWRRYLTGFATSLVAPFDDASTAIRGFLLGRSSVGRWASRTVPPHATDLATFEMTFCPDGAPCSQLRRAFGASIVPEDPIDRGLLFAGGIGLIALLSWLVGHARGRIVGDDSAVPDPRTAKVWIVSGPETIDEPALRAALRKGPIGRLDPTRLRDESASAKALRRLDAGHPVLVIGPLGSDFVGRPGPRRALLGFLRRRFDGSEAPHARDVVLVTPGGADALLTEMTGRVSPDELESWTRLFGACTVLTKRSTLQLWVGRSRRRNVEDAINWLANVSTRADEARWIPADRLRDQKTLDLATRPLLAVADIDVLFDGFPHALERRKLLGVLKQRVAYERIRERGTHDPRLVLLTSRVSIDDLVRRVSRRPNEGEEWRHLLEAFTEIEESAVGEGRPAGDARSGRELVELECAWDPELAGILRRDRDAVQRTIPSDARESAEVVATLAQSHYKRMWSVCSNDEKLALHHLAEGRLLNPKNRAVIDALLRRRILRRAPHLRIALPSFACYVRRVALPEEVESWSRAHSSTWDDLRIPLAVTLVAAGLLVVVAGGDSAVTLVSGLAAGVPATVQLVGRLMPGRSGGA